MKYLRLFESEQLQVGDIVICNKNLSADDDLDYNQMPKYVEKYEILRIYKYSYSNFYSNQTFLDIKELKTGITLKGWNIKYFTSEHEWNANKYNI